MQLIITLILLALAQMLFLGHLHIFGVVTPLLYVYLVLQFPRNTSHIQRLLLSFIMGITIDTFNNTQGLNAAALTLTGFIQPYILELFLRKEDAPDFRPSISSMGFLKYQAYAIPVLLLFFIPLYALELFSFNYWIECLTGCFGSLLLTHILIITIDSTRK